MAMFGFGKGSKHEDPKVKKDDKDLKPVKRVFGVPLETLSLVDAKCFDVEILSVPIAVRDTIEWLRQNKGLTEEGIFRVPGNQADVDALKRQYDTTGSAQLESHYEVHTIAGLLKLWFRELPEPVLIFRYYETFMKIGKNQDPVARKTNLRMLLAGLPEVNRHLIIYLMEFLRDVAANSDKNKMGTDNVALVFAPNILRPQGQQDQNSLLNDATAVKDILRLLIEELPFMRVGVLRSNKKNIGVGATPSGDTVGAALVSPRGNDSAVMSPREEAMMLSESTKIRTAVSKEEPKVKVAADAKKDEPPKKPEEKKGHKHSRSIGAFIPFVHTKDDDEKDGKADAQKSPQGSAHQRTTTDPPKAVSGKHIRTESHQDRKVDSVRKESSSHLVVNSAAPASASSVSSRPTAPKPVRSTFTHLFNLTMLDGPIDVPLQFRRSVSVQSLDDLRDLAKAIDLAAALNELGPEQSNANGSGEQQQS